MKIIDYNRILDSKQYVVKDNVLNRWYKVSGFALNHLIKFGQRKKYYYDTIYEYNSDIMGIKDFKLINKK